MGMKELIPFQRIRNSCFIIIFAALLYTTAGNLSPGTEGIPAVGTEDEQSDVDSYIEDTIVVPALGADISEVQLDENTVDMERENVISADNEPGEQNDQESQQQLASGDKSIPSSYDARTYGRITDVKNQSNNTCWAYSAVGTAETDLITKGIVVDGQTSTADNTYLSVNQLAYEFYHKPKDPLSLTDGDETVPIGDYLQVGGNHMFTTFALADWYGIASEKNTQDVDWTSAPDKMQDYSDSVHLQKAYWISMSKDAENVKKMIMQYGSVATSMYYSGINLNSDTAAYYNSGITKLNHAVQIIGWDDTFRASHFNHRPSSDGAWLVKNSRGTDFGDGGYFWISYQDAALTSSTAKAFLFDFEPADNYDYIYQYDGSAGAYVDNKAGSTGYEVTSGSSIANVFEVPSMKNVSYQNLRAVSFALFAVNINYSVQIYKNPTDSSDPESGERLLEEPLTGKTTFVGYYTIPIDQNIVLSHGDTFSVVVTLSDDSAENISYFADKTYQNGNWIKFKNQTAEGESFAQKGGSWKDLADEGATARIKAFTNSMENVKAIHLNAKKNTLWTGNTLQLNTSVEPNNAYHSEFMFQSSDPGIATVDENGLVTGKSSGNATITAETADGSGQKADCTLKVLDPVERVSVDLSTNKFVVGEEKQIPITLDPQGPLEDRIYIEIDDPSVATISDAGMVTGLKEGRASVSVYSSYDKHLLTTIDIQVVAQEKQSTKGDKNENTDIKTKDFKEGQASMVSVDQKQDALKDSKSPLTGDDQHPGNWMLLLISASLVLITVGKKMRSR